MPSPRWHKLPLALAQKTLTKFDPFSQKIFRIFDTTLRIPQQESLKICNILLWLSSIREDPLWYHEPLRANPEYTHSNKSQHSTRDHSALRNLLLRVNLLTIVWSFFRWLLLRLIFSTIYFYLRIVSKKNTPGTGEFPGEFRDHLEITNDSHFTVFFGTFMVGDQGHVQKYSDEIPDVIC